MHSFDWDNYVYRLVQDINPTPRPEDGWEKVLDHFSGWLYRKRRDWKPDDND